VDTYRAAVARAAQLAGGVRTLSQRLRVPMLDLTRWIQGEAKPSKGMFLRIVDFIAEESKTKTPRSPAAPRQAHDPLNRGSKGKT
jgi:hypothetical protein